MSNPSPVPSWESSYQRRSPLTPLTSAEASLSLMTQTGLALDAPILDVGCGTSAFLADLLALGYANLLAADCSPTALLRQRQQLGAEVADHILWVEDDVLNPQQLLALQPILLWHDQGLLQELTAPPEQAAYRRLLDYMVLPGGWVILAALAPHGNAARAGSQVPYAAHELAAFLGSAYQLQQHFQRPYGRLDEPAQPYTYALFRRDGQAQTSFRHAQWAAS